MKSQSGELRGSTVLYDPFRCEGCGSEGRLEAPAEWGIRIECPERCGAGYIQTRSVDGGPILVCVVCPVRDDPYADVDDYYLDDEEDENDYEIDEDFDDYLDDEETNDEYEEIEKREDAPADPRQERLDL